MASSFQAQMESVITTFIGPAVMVCSIPFIRKARNKPGLFAPKKSETESLLGGQSGPTEVQTH
ncbi:hypothetical protein KIPB_015646, partial [Kipferlia bialata]|eukprot:g15646.t1